ncbi:hypothetical protein KVT40_008012 [Elsinoe batatas]|uniref:FCP1 homology domain-containing protein n=1 Tax=Elsinoe batatas TaxID=2601811 RepID=A0A8K0KSE9_9PEZI|nr:hypothetical protein KVT40_008012 [Elsinoe batatas]
MKYGSSVWLYQPIRQIYNPLRGRYVRDLSTQRYHATKLSLHLTHTSFTDRSNLYSTLMAIDSPGGNLAPVPAIVRSSPSGETTDGIDPKNPRNTTHQQQKARKKKQKLKEAKTRPSSDRDHAHSSSTLSPSNMRPAARFTYVNPFDQLLATAASSATTSEISSKAPEATFATSQSTTTSVSATTSSHKYNTRSKALTKKETSDQSTTATIQPDNSVVPGVDQVAAPLTKHSRFEDASDQLAQLSINDTAPSEKAQTKKSKKKKASPSATVVSAEIKTPAKSTKSKHIFSPRGSGRPPPAEKMAIPKPSPEYLSYCSSSPPTPCEPQRLLVILDVNGTLGFRKSLRTITPRPHLREFLTYLFREHDVAIWTSMTRSNFMAVLPKIMTKEQAAKLKMVWTREDMNLGNNFKDYVQTYKELTKVWAHLNGDEVPANVFNRYAAHTATQPAATSQDSYQQTYGNGYTPSQHGGYSGYHDPSTAQPQSLHGGQNYQNQPSYYQTYPSGAVQPPSHGSQTNQQPFTTRLFFTPAPIPGHFNPAFPPTFFQPAPLPFTPPSPPSLNSAPPPPPPAPLPFTSKYGPHNTILIDDSLKKALSEPYNHVVVTEWEGPNPRPSQTTGRSDPTSGPQAGSIPPTTNPFHTDQASHTTAPSHPPSTPQAGSTIHLGSQGNNDTELLRVKSLIEELRRGDSVARESWQRAEAGRIKHGQAGEREVGGREAGAREAGLDALLGSLAGPRVGKTLSGAGGVGAGATGAGGGVTGAGEGVAGARGGMAGTREVSMGGGEEVSGSGIGMPAGGWFEWGTDEGSGRGEYRGETDGR